MDCLRNLNLSQSNYIRRLITEDIIIVGGGPAGAYLGYCLAKKDIQATIFDDSHPREKPCGGGISVLAIEKFPILHKIPVGKSPDNEIKIISPNGKEVIIEGKKSSWSISRRHLDKFLLDKAVENGAKLIEERVMDFENKNDKWVLKTKNGIYKSNIIIGADGANSLIRSKIIGPIPKENLGFCYGCFAKSEKNEYTTIKFFKKRQGYAWCFPREDHLSIGVGMELLNSRNLKNIFEDFISFYYPHIEIISKWGAIIPLAKDPKFFEISCCDEKWAVLGDAAGHVDPITGEGITYALWSAELACEAIVKNNLSLFDDLWRKEYGYNLIESSKFRKMFFNYYLLEFSIKIASRSETFRRILYDLIVSEQEQKTLMKRMIKDLPKVTIELLSFK